MEPMRSFFTFGWDWRNSNRGVQIALGAVFGKAAHQFVRDVGRRGDFAAIQIDRQRDVALVRQLRGLVLHPIVKPPPFVNDDQRRKWSFAGRRVEDSLHSFVAAFVGDGLAVGGEGQDGKQDNEHQQADSLHGFRPFS